MQDQEKIETQGANEGSTPDPRSFIQMAESSRLHGLYKEAIEILRSGLGIRPDVLPGWLLLGRCYLEKGMITEAKEALETVAKGIEECFPVYKMLSQVYIQEKDVDKAFEAMRKTLYFQSTEEGVPQKVTPLEMGLLHRGSHPPFAAHPAPPAVSPQEPAREDRSVKGEDEGAKTVIQTDTLAEIYLKQGHLDRALSVYQEILAREPDNAAVKGKYESLKKRAEREIKTGTRKKVQARLERWLTLVSSRRGTTPP